MTMREPELVQSDLCREVSIDGSSYRIEIYRIETLPQWSLEVVDEEGVSTVWDDLFNTDQDALDEVLRSINEEGASAFQETGNIVPFPTVP